jgi:branched-chain amino acid transport system ATP-binding protein
MMTTDVLHARALSVGYSGTAVVRDMDLRVGAGEVVALLGRNGAGKTTTLRTIAGLLRPVGGQVEITGRVTSAPLHARARRGLAFVTEERAVIHGLTVHENLRLGSGQPAAAYELFPELKDLRRRKAGVLSGGEQQMLALGRSLAARPALLLVDELSLGLSPIIVQRLMMALRAAATAGTAVLLVEQHPAVAFAIASRGYVLSQGEVALSGPVAELRTRMADIEASYLSGATERDVAGRQPGGKAHG